MTRVAMRGITRRFGAVVANDGIDFDLAAGEVHGLLGENGSGKTTLMSVLYGLIEPDAGTIALDGQPFRPHGPAASRHAGIAMIPQRFRLVPTLTVAENVTLGLEPHGRRHSRLLDETRRRLIELGERYSLAVDPDAVVESLSMGQRQRVEILRALYNDARILLMDEPTSVLTPNEVERLFAMLNTMVREEHRTVVIVTHKLREVIGFADRMTILRQGRKVATFDRAEATAARLVSAMMGGRMEIEESAAPHHRSEEKEGERPALEVRGVGFRPLPSDTLVSESLEDVSFAVRGGEIFGIAGVEGNGQQELELLLAGVLAPNDGEIRIDGAPAAEARGRLAYIPSDGQRLGLIPDLSVTENLLLPETARGSAWRQAVRSSVRARTKVRDLIARFHVSPPNPRLRARQLSGGNAQKVLLAREFGRWPAVIIAAQPTMGLDVASATFVRSELQRAAGEGAAVVMISSDLDELLECCDRISVMYRGRLQGEWPCERASVSEIGAAMAGVSARDRELVLQ